MLNIVSVDVLTGRLKTMLGHATISIRTTFSYEPALIEGIANAKPIADVILDQRQEVLTANTAQPQTTGWA